MVEPNLTRSSAGQMEEVDATEVRTELNERIRNLFGMAGGKFNLPPFPAGPYEVPDEVGDGRPILVVLRHEALAIYADPQGLPPDIDEIFKHKGADQRLREFRNNLVFVAADERKSEHEGPRSPAPRPSLELRKPDRNPLLADHQQGKVKEEFAEGPPRGRGGHPAVLPAPVLSLQQPDGRRPEPIAHAVIEVPNASDSRERARLRSSPGS